MRGYVIAADRQFLEPYYDGQRGERAAADDIRQSVWATAPTLIDRPGRDRTSRCRLAGDVRRAAHRQRDTGRPRAWWTTRQRSAARPNSTVSVNFSIVQNEHLAAARHGRRRRARQMRALARRGAGRRWSWRSSRWRSCSALLVRSAVTRPLAALAAACRRITEGNFGERIVPRGPKDIRAIAADVEDMRQRIVDELEASRAAREALDEQAEELRRSNAELEQFAYVASHDLQEPLRKVASFCQLLEKRYGDKLDERGAEYIGFAVDGAKRMQALINDLLTFSRVGRLNATHTEVDLDATLDTALDNLVDRDRGVGRRDRAAAHAAPDRRRRPDAADDAVAEPHRQRGEVPARRRRAADRHRMRAGHRCSRPRMALQRLGQRHRHRRGVRRQGVRHLPAPARPRGVQRHRHRSSVVQEDRRAPRRNHLGRHVLHPREPESGSPCPPPSTTEPNEIPTALLEGTHE